ncbi:MAG TPA: sigma-70 family RNA polymerase sigma factor [Planctomycetaceae bacterium]|nr:sigma-70 family RNA polymerase sigma factor [Planctomycetaceae bacterium]
MDWPSEHHSGTQTPPQGWIAEVFAARRQTLVNYTSHLLRRDCEEAADVVQDSFVRLCQQPWPEIESKAVAWLYRTCRNRAIDILRREKRMSTAKLGDEATQVTDTSAGDPGHAIDQDEQLGRVREQLASLSRKQQEVLRLRLHDGLSYKQIAEVTGLTVSNVGYQIHDAIIRLRRKLHAEGG